jgi:putative nucleotidyltransferase with HDIG domain
MTRWRIGSLDVPVLALFTGARGRNTARSGDDVADLYLSTFEALALAVDAKYRLTYGHVQRVQHNAVMLAREVGIADEALLKAIEAAALLHDLGKLAIPDHLLNKPGPLTGPEFEQVKQHVVIGAEILSAARFPYPLVPIVRHHHENWDGTGYPDGLLGPEIPIGARVLSVTDCYDALTSDRPYRRALSPSRAVAMICERRGTMYDPAIVDAFLRIQPNLPCGAARRSDHARGEQDAPAERRALSGVEGPAPSGVERPALSGVEGTHVRRAGEETEPLDEDRVSALVRRMLTDTPAELVVWFRHDAAIGQLVARVAIGLGAEGVRARLLAPATGISGWVAVTKDAVRNSDPALDYGAHGGDAGPLASGSTLAIAADTSRAVSDVLTLYAQGRDRFTAADELLALQVLGSAADRRRPASLPAKPLDSAQGRGVDPADAGALDVARGRLRPSAQGAPAV